MARKVVLLFSLALISMACSIYQSEGRDFMEDQGIEKLSAQSKGHLISNGYCLETPPLVIDSNRYIPLGAEEKFGYVDLKTYMSSSLIQPRALVQYRDTESEKDYLCILNYDSLADLNFEIYSNIEEAVQWIETQVNPE